MNREGVRASRRLNLPPDSQAAMIAAPARPYLETIPAELRLQIYRELLVSPEVIDIDWKKVGLHPNIMRTCKAIFRESHPVLYDENTFWLRLGIPAELMTAVPITPPTTPPRPGSYSAEEWNRCLSDAESPASRGLYHSYLNDVFPQFLQGSFGSGCLTMNLHVNSRFVARRQHNYEHQKLPCRLVITIQCKGYDGHRYKLELLAQSLQHIPRIHSLAISCENAPAGFWSTSAGEELGERLCAYVGGSVRGVGVIQTHNIPEVYASVLRRELVGSKPTSALLSMFRSLTHYRWKLFLCGEPSVDIKWLHSEHIDQAHRAVEKGDWEAFRHYRELEMHSVKDMTIENQAAEIDAVYKHDPGEWKQELDSDVGRRDGGIS